MLPIEEAIKSQPLWVIKPVYIVDVWKNVKIKFGYLIPFS